MHTAVDDAYALDLMAIDRRRLLPGIYVSLYYQILPDILVLDHQCFSTQGNPFLMGS